MLGQGTVLKLFGPLGVISLHQCDGVSLCDWALQLVYSWTVPAGIHCSLWRILLVPGQFWAALPCRRRLNGAIATKGNVCALPYA